MTVRIRVLLVATFATIVCARMPDVWLYGRLWAEEGRVFYERAATLPWSRALLMPYAGYLNLVASAAPLVARQLLPLAYIPWFTTCVGLFFQCCPAILLVCSRDDCLRSRTTLVCALLLIATPPLVEEVWLQTLTSQFHLSLCAALILALDTPRPRSAMFVFGCLLLLLAPLCGPSAWLLAPLFAARTLLDRSLRRLVQTIFLGAGTLVQVAFFYHHAGRSLGIHPVVLLCVVYTKNVIVPLFGRDLAAIVSGPLQARLAHGQSAWLPVAVVTALFILFAFALVRRRHPASTWLFLSALVLGGVAYFGAIDGGVHLLIIGNEGRYSFLPEVLVALTTLSIATGTRSPDQWLARAGVVWLLVVGMLDIPSSGAKTGPRWLPQVTAWQRDHSHPIAIWPPGWDMRLQAP